MEDFADIRRRLKEGQYRMLGSGSGRKVFDMGNGYVVKAAKNMKGIAQNRTEYEISFNHSSTIVAKTIDISSNYKYLIMEKAEKLKDFYYVLQYYNANNLKEILAMDEIRAFIS